MYCVAEFRTSALCGNNTEHRLAASEVLQVKFVHLKLEPVINGRKSEKGRTSLDTNAESTNRKSSSSLFTHLASKIYNLGWWLLLLTFPLSCSV